MVSAAEPMPNRLRPIMRREPVQRRSTARVSSILDACAALLDTYDYDELTTSKIAERASVPIGSLYQYFPDKRAVVQALTMRNLERFSEEVERIFAGDRAPNGWQEAVNRVIDAYLRMLGEVPGFGRIGFGDVVDTNLLDKEDDNDAVIAAKLAQLFAKRFQVQNTDELQLAFLMVVEVADALIKLALRLSDKQRDTALTAAREIVWQILRQHMDTVS